MAEIYRAMMDFRVEDAVCVIAAAEEDYQHENGESFSDQHGGRAMTVNDALQQLVAGADRSRALAEAGLELTDSHFDTVYDNPYPGLRERQAEHELHKARLSSFLGAEVG